MAFALYSLAVVIFDVYRHRFKARCRTQGITIALCTDKNHTAIIHNHRHYSHNRCVFEMENKNKHINIAMSIEHFMELNYFQSVGYHESMSHFET